jgi:hypothetical protein
VKGNIIIFAANGIDFHCNANPNVRSNIINNGGGFGLNHVPSGLGTSTNKVFNTLYVRTGC